MKTLPIRRCLVMATISLLPAIGSAQEAEQSTEPSAAQSVPEKRYVSDKLVLNVYAEADQGSARVATIQTGDAVEELERATNMAHVRLEDGREGWVGVNYLTSDAPAIVRLRELERGQKKTDAPGPDKASIDLIASLNKENAALKAAVSELHDKAAAAAAVQPAQSASIQPANESPAVTSSDGSIGPWWAWLIGVAATGALGYAVGYQTLARRLRRKFGALKIY